MRAPETTTSGTGAFTTTWGGGGGGELGFTITYLTGAGVLVGAAVFAGTLYTTGTCFTGADTGTYFTGTDTGTALAAPTALPMSCQQCSVITNTLLSTVTVVRVDNVLKHAVQDTVIQQSTQ